MSVEAASERSVVRVPRQATDEERELINWFHEQFSDFDVTYDGKVWEATGKDSDEVVRANTAPILRNQLELVHQKLGTQPGEPC
jgi:hypothetical protein